MNRTAPNTAAAGLVVGEHPADAELRGRDLAIDAYRALAMFVVVAWHWVFTIAVWEPDGPRVDNPISFVPGLGYLTWVWQVMPLFFLVGGYVTLRTVVGMDQSETWAWSRRRVARLAGPAAPLVAALAAGWLLARLAGSEPITSALVLTATPLWFLGCYLVISLVVPVVAPAARRWPVGHVVALGLFCLAWDAARFGGWLPTGFEWLSMLTVWLTVHQLGGLLDRVARQVAAGLVVAALALLWFATHLGPYPVSMVGTTSDEVTNMGPATAVLIPLAVLQLGLVVSSRPAVGRLARRRPAVVAAASSYAMPVYLWHMIGFAACVLLASGLGVALPSEPTLGWWLSRPLWVAGPAIFAAPLIRLARRGGGRRASA